MPTIEVRCQPDWLPPEEGQVLGQGSTTLCMAEWVVELTPSILNDIDHLADGDAIKPSAVWADFHPMHKRAINHVDVLIEVHPPEVDFLTFAERKLRRELIAVAYLDELSARLLAECDHLFVPNWEIEVIPVESSGFGLNPRLDITHDW